MKRTLVVLIGVLMPLVNFAQCAMCRTQVENNVSTGDMSLGQALNYGILYLFITPYIALGTVAFFWFRMSKKNERKVRFSQRF